MGRGGEQVGGEKREDKTVIVGEYSRSMCMDENRITKRKLYFAGT